MRSCLFLLILFTVKLSGQWHEIDRHIEGVGWNGNQIENFSRLPENARSQVRDEVWSLSRHSAGLMIRFISNSKKITIRYQTSDRNYSMDHMPATGKSGVDLYVINGDGEEAFCAARRNFGDTIYYTYDHLNVKDTYHELGKEYRLYLPLYNHVDWLQIQVEDGVIYEQLPVRKALPIVVYGTSIAQGACASRPGMAWTNILSRKLDRPFINLAFSGNGRLEHPLIKKISAIEAKLYVLDCLPNLSLGSWDYLGIKSNEELENRIISAVRLLRKYRPKTPILLVDHAGYTEEFSSKKRGQDYQVPNQIQHSAYVRLKNDGMKNLYYLTNKELNLSMDAMVDGVHPNDYGMMQYAETYEAKIRTILHEPTGKFSTTRPITQHREPGNYNWEERHNEILALNQAEPPKIVMFANSIFHYWGGKPEANMAREPESWDNVFTPLGMRNQAYGWDRIENVLWRVYHGELDGFEAEKILILIGTNNMHINSDHEILAGLRQLVEAVKIRQPSAEIVLMGILPRRGYVERIKALNFEIASLSQTLNIRYKDIGHVLLNDDGTLNESLFSDGLHPVKEGYLKMRKGIHDIVK